MLNIRKKFNPFPNKPWFFMCLQYKSFENTGGKGEIAHNEQFLLFPQCFLSVWGTFFYLHQTYNCCLQTLSVWKSLKFVIWERFIRPLLKLFKFCKFATKHDTFHCVFFQGFYFITTSTSATVRENLNPFPQNTAF